tara:strand:+ start:27 stop:371 length:345 start_codon:yes stop_codon:yes gene_type:complete
MAEALAITRNVRMSAKKVLPVARRIQGMNARRAHAALTLSPRKSAHWLAKTLQSAMANAANNKDLNPDAMVVKEAIVGQAKPWKRWMTRARGGADTILKRTCHIRIVLTEKAED